MNYSQFKTEYKKIFEAMLGYTLNQAGSKIYAEKLADLEDEYPDFAAKLENEHCGTV